MQELRNLLEKMGPLTAKPELKFGLSRITKGPAYNQLPLGPDDGKTTWNTDRVPIFHSPQYSVWPLEVAENELL